MLLQIQKFIAAHSDWEKILSEKPYCITIVRDEVYGRKLVMFKYSQVDSDFKIDLVRECRGLILEDGTWNIVCWPFMKFFNYGECNAASIDWNTAFVSEKLDGSLIKIVTFGDDILISTNGTIDAFKAPIVPQIGCSATNFGELALQGFDYYYHVPSASWMHNIREKIRCLFRPGFTYMFELTSPFNKVVVAWHETKINFIGVRNNTTGQEIKFTEHPFIRLFDTPKLFALKTVNDCIKAAEALSPNAEGYVACDAAFNRIKIKSPTYVALHHMKNNGSLSFARGIDIIRSNELDEVLDYFPEFKAHLLTLKTDYLNYVEDAHMAELKLVAWQSVHPDATRKDAALFIMSAMNKFSGFAFRFLDKKITSFTDEIDKLPADKIVAALGCKAQ